MPDWKINIITEADNSGAQQAAQGLEDVSKSTNKASDSASELEKNGRKLHRVFSEIDKVAPGMGEAMQIAFHAKQHGAMLGIVLAGGAMVEVFATIREHLQEIEARGREAFIKLRESAYEAQVAITQLHEKNEDFWDAVRRHKEENAAKSQYEVEIDLIHKQIEAQQKLLEAQKAAELETIAAAVSSNKMTKEQGEARKAQVEAYYRDLSSGQSKQANESESAARQKRIDELERELSGASEMLKRVQQINTSGGASQRDADIARLKQFITELNASYSKSGTETINAPEILGAFDPVAGRNKVFANEPNTKTFSESAEKLLEQLERDKSSRETTQKTLEEKLTSLTSEIEGLRLQQATAKNTADANNSVASGIRSLNQLAERVKDILS